MARRGGLMGEGGLLSRAVEAATTAFGVEVLPVSHASTLREAATENRLLDRELRNLGWQSYRFAASMPQDMEPEDRLQLAAKVRLVAVSDAQFRRSIMLRIAFCFGRGVQMPKAPDADVQEVIRAFWEDPDNQTALLSPPAQWRKGWEVWTQANVFWQVFDDGLDGLVKLGQVDHDTVRDAVWDAENGQSVTYYVGTETVGGGWSYDRDEAIPATGVRTVYYEALESSMARAGQPPDQPAPEGKTKPGRMLHLSVNRNSRQAFGIPEGKANIRWASAMNDLLGAQVERAKAAMAMLSKVSVKGSRRQMMETASRVASRKGPIGATSDFAGAAGAPPPGARPGSQFWQNEAVNIEPLTLDSQSSSAQQNIAVARDQFAAGTNFGSHYFGGDPGSLAGSVALELPAEKLTQLDQELWEGAVFKRLVDRAITRAVEVGTLTVRREPTPEEVARGIELDDDGTVPRDLTYEFSMPRAVERDLPSVVGMIADSLVAIDPNGEHVKVTKWFVARMLRDAYEVDDPSALVDEWWPDDEDMGIEEDQGADPEPDEGTGGPDDGRPAPSADEGTIGPDGKRHKDPANQLGAKRNSPAVEAVWDRMMGGLS